MKTACLSFGVLAFSLLITAAQDQALSSKSRAESADQKQQYAVTERGAHHKVWERDEDEIGPDGKPFPRKRSYTELATGMHFKNARGEWEESKEEIEILPDNAGAIARKGQHKAIFPPEVKSGLIELQTPDQKWMRSRVWGLAYFDSATGESVLLAEVKESEGQIIGDNVVLYPDAFTDFVADIRYTYMRAGFEQDVVLREQPPAPEEFNLNPKTTRLQVLTEFVESPMPTKQKAQAGELADETLGFGVMNIGSGKAFSVEADGESNSHVPVAKQWERIEGRDFLIEQVSHEKVVRQLEKLPTPSKLKSAALERRGQGETALAGLKRMMPRPYAQAAPQPTTAKPKRMAKAEALNTPSFVMDYITLTSQTNYTFNGDTTYYISGGVNLSGTTTIEGGCVVKFGVTSSETININDPEIIWKTAPYRPAIFTAKDDNSVGQTISGSSGVPSGFYGGGLAYVGYFGVETPAINHVRFCYLRAAVTLGFDESQIFNLANAQFVKCSEAVFYIGSLNVENTLFYRTETLILTPEAETVWRGTHLTVNECGIFNNAWKSELSLTNCLLMAVTNINGPDVYSTTWLTNSNVQVANPVGKFQSVGGGAHYLATNSPYRNIGNTNISATLLASLREKTTYPPIAYTNVTFTTPVTFSPQAQRDTDTPDLGYHYDPLDYSFGGCHANSNITFTAGTAVGWFRTASGWSHTGQGIHLADKKVGLFDGTATAPCYWVRLNTVQENDRTAGYGPGGFTGWASTSANVADLYARFTRFSMMSYDGNHIRDDNHYLNLHAQNCEFYGGGVGGYGISMYLTNNLFFRTYLAQVSGSDCEVVMRNCTMIGNLLQAYPYDLNPPTIKIFDSAFDGVAYDMNPIYIYDPMADEYVPDWSMYEWDHNAYSDASNPIPVGAANDVPSVVFDWLEGALGSFYQTWGSDLMDAGSVTADAVGLYHFTTMPYGSYYKETTSQVDIGYHYVEVDGNGKPLDSDSDSTPDYLEDANGNGTVQSGETDWQSATDYGLRVWITEPKRTANLP